MGGEKAVSEHYFLFAWLRLPRESEPQNERETKPDDRQTDRQTDQREDDALCSKHNPKSKPAALRSSTSTTKSSHSSNVPPPIPSSQIPWFHTQTDFPTATATTLHHLVANQVTTDGSLLHDHSIALHCSQREVAAVDVLPPPLICFPPISTSGNHPEEPCFGR